MLGTLYIIAAPSGGGKTSLVTDLIKAVDHVVVSISHTTRPMRPGEENGVNYFFVSVAEFESMIAEGIFLEYANVFGHYYGTSHRFVKEQLERGNDVILEIDWQGAQAIRQKMPESVHIFILPPSLEVLQHRLESRGQDDLRTIEKRMAEAKSEISHCSEFDYWIVNENFDKALQDLLTVFKSHRLSVKFQQESRKTLLNELLK